MLAEELISTLGQRLGAPGLALSKEHTCAAEFDDDVLFFEHHERRLFIIAEIGELPLDMDNLRYLMQANHLGRGSAFGSLGFDKRKGLLTLTRVLADDLAYQKFEDQLSLFIAAVRFWKVFLQQGGLQQPKSFSPADLVNLS
ncbi:MAG: type III secretion system chaperone [Succinivibrio sp.]|nr:type III secretion system chaperone [Succinivibrio sp.]